jgi:hypothetical protein
MMLAVRTLVLLLKGIKPVDRLAVQEGFVIQEKLAVLMTLPVTLAKKIVPVLVRLNVLVL